jgi:hypothetical protein
MSAFPRFAIESVQSITAVRLAIQQDKLHEIMKRTLGVRNRIPGLSKVWYEMRHGIQDQDMGHHHTGIGTPDTATQFVLRRRCDA